MSISSTPDIAEPRTEPDDPDPTACPLFPEVNDPDEPDIPEPRIEPDDPEPYPLPLIPDEDGLDEPDLPEPLTEPNDPELVVEPDPLVGDGVGKGIV